MYKEHLSLPLLKYIGHRSIILTFTVVTTHLFAMTGCLTTQSIKSDPKIYHGSDAPSGKYPWMVSLGGRGGSCGGVLIASAVVLTAKHCNAGSVMIGGVLRRFEVTADLNIIEENDAPHTRVVLGSDEWSGADGFLEGDIRLLYLKSPVLGVTPIALNGSSAIPKGSTTKKEADENRDLIALGWGTTQKGTISPILQEVKLSSYTPDGCKAQLYYVRKDEICTGVWGTDIGAFQGDSGGPLITMYQNQPLLLGIASNAHTKEGRTETGTRVKGMATNFARVSSAIPWIQERAKVKGFVVKVLP